MKYSLLPLFILMFIHAARSQDGVGIGRPDPDPSAVLHISSPNKGVLFPDGEPVDINNISSPANGLFLYDRVFNRYVYRKNTTWMYLNPWDTEAVNPDNGPAANEDITVISTPYEVQVNNDVTADHFNGFGVVPIGGIIMWSGPVGNIPSNYELCDGGSRNGVNIPNLVGRFVRAAASAGGTGGVNTSTRTEISFIETPRYTIQEPTCSQYQFIYTVSWTADCAGDGGPPSPLDSFTGSMPANSCNEAFFHFLSADWADRGCFTIPVTYSSCTTSPNPNYYLTRAACRNNDVVELDVVTDNENRPQYYELAYIIRVE